MLKSLWRDWRAPKAVTVRERPTEPAIPAAPISDLQIFRGYEPEELALFEQFAVKREPRAVFVTDFLGGRTRISSLYDAVASTAR
jgi:hypothetical protein